jgi:acyl-coenzyme A synthetase/AMP-(fatty) acid ligase
MQWLNERVGKTQRLAALHLIDELPRNPIGKVLKRELREQHATGRHGGAASDQPLQQPRHG